MVRFLFSLCLFLAFFSPPLSAQDETALPDTTTVDSLIKEARAFPGTYAETPLDTVRTQNPTVALFKSMLVPGLGQIGNKSYFKAGLAIGLESVFIGAIIHWAKKTNDARAAFDNAPDTAIGLRAELYNTYSDYKDQRNFYSWMLGTTIFLSMFDAYVDAHLRQFPKFRKDEGFSWDIGPAAPNRFAVTLSWKF